MGEYVNANDVITRNKEFNPRLETGITNILEHIETSVANSRYFEHSKTISAKVTVNELTLKLENKLVDDLPFKWKFYMQNSKNVDSTIMKEFIVNPLVLTIQRLIFENSKLKEIITAKDKEIQDYKE